MKEQYIKPIPAVQPWTEAFWKASKKHTLLIQKCGSCGKLIFYPRERCPECWSKDLGWQESSGKGKVYTFTIVRDMVEPKFVSDLPYVLAMVELEESIRMMTRVVECDPEAVRIGMEVEVVFEDITDSHALPLFRPVDEALRIAPARAEEASCKDAEPASFMSPDDYQTIRYETGGPNGAVCRITMNRPEKRNSINRRMAVELRDAFRRVREDRQVGVVVFSGAGDSFCSGGDLDVFPSLAEHQRSLNWLAHEGFDVQKAITECEKVVIAKIEGNCLAGGLEIALCCDLLYAKESARMGFTEINMGVLPGWGGTARIVRSMPVFRAREIVYSGRKDYTARDMYEMGLLTRVFKDEEFEEQFEKAVAHLAAKKPIALRMGKEIMAKSADGGGIDAALAVERNGIQWLTYAPDVQAMMDQFRKNIKN